MEWKEYKVGVGSDRSRSGDTPNSDFDWKTQNFWSRIEFVVGFSDSCSDLPIGEDTKINNRKFTLIEAHGHLENILQSTRVILLEKKALLGVIDFLPRDILIKSGEAHYIMKTFLRAISQNQEVIRKNNVSDRITTTRDSIGCKITINLELMETFASRLYWRWNNQHECHLKK